MEITKLIAALQREHEKASPVELVVKVKDKAGEVISDIAYYDIEGGVMYLRLEPVK